MQDCWTSASWDVGDGLNAVTRNKRVNRLTPEPKAWWQSVIAGEGLPNGRTAPVNVKFRRRKCEGTVEDYRRAALDVRELYRHGVFNWPAGTVWGNAAMRWPWLRSFRLI